MQTTRTPGRERRRQDLPGRIARATYPVRQALQDFIEGFPCNVVGHRWVEIPESLRRSAKSDGSRMRFQCSRCSIVGGFSN